MGGGGSLRSNEVRFIAGILLIAAILIIGFGLILLYDSQSPMPTSVRGVETFEIPDGAEWHSFVELEMAGEGKVSVEFSEVADGVVEVYLFRQWDYLVYQDTGLVPVPLGSVSGSSGAFVVEVPGEGTYYLVFAHGNGSEASAQLVRVAYTFAGLWPIGPDHDLARGAFALILFGAAMGNVGGFLLFRARNATLPRGS